MRTWRTTHSCGGLRPPQAPRDHFLYGSRTSRPARSGTGSGPSWSSSAGAKEEAIRREFGIDPTAYYQLLSRLIDDPAATAYDPMLVKRLQRQRASRHRQRSGRRLSPPNLSGGT